MAVSQETIPGKDAAEATVTLPVTGMSCAACQSHVERALRETPGVEKAEVNLMTHTARVVFDPQVAKPADLVRAVKDSGYDASLPSAETEDMAHMHSSGSEGRLRLRAFATLGMAALAMALSVPVMGGMNGAGFISRLVRSAVPFLYHVPVQALEIFLLALTLFGMALAAGEVYQPAWKAMLHRATNMNTLVALGTIAALLYSAAATFAPLLFRSRGLSPDVYYESVLFILAFLMLGRWLEARAKDRTQDALKAFLRLQPRTARVIRAGLEVEVAAAEVKSGETVVLRPGERVPVDGVILKGTSSVDESLLTGESVPVPHGPGDRLIGGSLNYDGSLEYRATAVGTEGVLGQMLRLMQQAQASRAPTQQLADRVSAIFVPVVLGIAAATFVAWMLFDHGNLGYAFAAAVTVLVIACPCAMGLAVPAALTVAIGRGAQLGVLIKSGESLERLARVDTIAFDKTGTLTEGRPRIVNVYPAEGVREDQLLMLAASVENRSEHPLGRAVLERASEAGIALHEASEVRAIPGKGVSGLVDGQRVVAGNAVLFRELEIAVPEIPAGAEALSLLLVAADGRYRGLLAARDELRPGAADAVAQIKRRGLRTVMLTGDNAASAEAIAVEAGLNHFCAQLLPEEKLAHIRELQRSGKKVAMVGDGINDAAALAQADAGIAMGTGADLAREAGDVVLLRGELRSVVDAFDLARATLRTMHVNLGWALGYNLLGIPVAAGVLYPVFGILLSPALASAAMALSSISVLVNSLRLRSLRAE
jgi:Cu+-exporting ATPase